MLANHEHRVYPDHSLVWVGKYRNLKNISHWHFDHEIVCCESGSAAVLIDQKTYILDSGSCLFIRGQSVHSITSDPDTTLYVALFSEKLLPRITDEYCLNDPLFVDHYDVLTALKKIRRLDFDRTRFYDEKINSLMQQIVIDIFSNEEVRKDRYTQSKVIRQYKDLLYDIDENISDYSFERGAVYMNMSDAYFSRFFKKMSGLTFSQYLNHIRVNKAIDLIREKEYHMTQIASLCGFDTIRNFNRVFHQITGYSPRRIPDDYILNLRSNSNNSSSFDPTLSVSELMPD